MIAAPVIGEMALSYARDAGVFTDTKQNVDGAFWSVVETITWLGSQTWYTHFVAFTGGGVVGFLSLLFLDRRRSPEPVQSGATFDSLALLKAIRRSHATISQELFRNRSRRPTDFTQSHAEWDATQVALTKQGFAVPAHVGPEASVLAMRAEYLVAIEPLVRDGHIVEARAKSKVIASEVG